MAYSSPYKSRSRAERSKPSSQIPGSNMPMGSNSRSLRGRLKRERQIERRFAWTFAVVVSATTLYLVMRSPWGIAVLAHWHLVL